MIGKNVDLEWFDGQDYPPLLYERISLMIGDLISGLDSGTRLPSQSVLAKEWKVSKMTIKKAVEECSRRGWIYNQGNKLFSGDVSNSRSHGVVPRRQIAHRMLSPSGGRERLRPNVPNTDGSENKSSVLSKWQKVFLELEKRISNLPDGTKLDSESNLAKEFLVSRLTARKAVTELKRQRRVYTDGLRTFVGRRVNESVEDFAVGEDRFEYLLNMSDRWSSKGANAPDEGEPQDLPFALSKWKKVFLELERRISELSDGTKLDSESNLAKEFSVSRLTARKAVTELKRQGRVHSEGNKTFVGDRKYRGRRSMPQRNVASRAILDNDLFVSEQRPDRNLLQTYLASIIRDIGPQLLESCPNCNNYDYAEEHTNDERAIWCSFCGQRRTYVCESCGENNRIHADRIQFCRFCGKKRISNESRARGSEASS